MQRSVKCMLPYPLALCMHGLWHGPLTLKFKFFKWSCLSYVKTDYFDWKFKSRNFLKRARPRMQAPLHSPKSLKIPSLTNQINPSSYLLTHYHSQNPKSLPKPKKYQKRQKDGKTCKKCKNENWLLLKLLIPVDDYNHSWWRKIQKHIKTTRFSGAQ